MAEPKPVDTPEFWARRLAEAPDLRRAIWIENDASWDRMEARHREVLAREISPADSVIDAGCGYGRLLDLMPKEWTGHYHGMDISPELIAKAKELHRGTGYWFAVGDLSSANFTYQYFDVAVCVMLKHMLTTHVGTTYWTKVEAELRRVAKRLLILEPEEVAGD